MSAPAKPLNGNTRMYVASLADEELKRLYRERSALMTTLRKVCREIADLELVSAATGVETVDADEPEAT